MPSHARQQHPGTRGVSLIKVASFLQAVKIALETKKYLVDNNLQDVTQVWAQQKQQHDAVVHYTSH